MRISVVHSTLYRYGTPVLLEPQTFRLRPRSDATQRLVHYAIDIDPTPAGQSWCLDQDGNVVLNAWFHAPADRLSVTSSFEVETLRENPFDFVLGSSSHDITTLTPYQTPWQASAAVADYSRAKGDAASDVLAFLWCLNRALFEDFAHTVREEGPPELVDATLSSRAGTCRDLAVLFCEACRVQGLAARFVSGYEQEASLQERAHMHAWAEVYLPGGGWRGYDPSQGLAVATSHVAVAAAADPLLAAPVSGSYRGGAQAELSYSIAMQVA